MANQLLPPIELAPDDLGQLTPAERAAVWFDMLDAGHKLVWAGLTREVGPDGDVRAAYRKWYAAQMDEHDRTVERMLWRMQQGPSPHAC
jgi:hypothetical protein